MTDHDLAVKMVLRGIDVFKEVNKDMSADAFTVTLLPVVLMGCFNAVIQVHMMKQLAAAVSNKEVKL